MIEAIVENLDGKKQTYAALEQVIKRDTIVASNTSSLCITELAASTTRPDRFAGLHFFNPVPLMKLVEVIRALQTSDDTYQTVFAFAQSLGKEAVTARTAPGSSSTDCSCRTCSMPFARTRTDSGPLKTSTTP